MADVDSGQAVPAADEHIVPVCPAPIEWNAGGRWKAVQPLHGDLRIDNYVDERQLGPLHELIDVDLSEPYSVFTYRYFVNAWPDLCFLAMRGDETVGGIICRIDEHVGSDTLSRRRGYVAMLVTRPDCRRMGIASNLVVRAIETMVQLGVNEVVLETEVTNAASLKLYGNLGFVRDKRLFRYYLNGVDAFRLKLWLTN